MQVESGKGLGIVGTGINVFKTDGVFGLYDGYFPFPTFSKITSDYLLVYSDKQLILPLVSDSTYKSKSISQVSTKTAKVNDSIIEFHINENQDLLQFGKRSSLVWLLVLSAPSSVLLPILSLSECKLMANFLLAKDVTTNTLSMDFLVSSKKKELSLVGR